MADTMDLKSIGVIRMSSNLIIGTKYLRSKFIKKEGQAAEKVQRLTENVNIVSTGTIYD